MVINENNSHINSFTKGMNSDQAYDQLLNTQYTYAKNVRITKNQLIGDSTGDYSSVHEGIVTPIYKGFVINDNVWDKVEESIMYQEDSAYGEIEFMVDVRDFNIDNAIDVRFEYQGQEDITWVYVNNTPNTTGAVVVYMNDNLLNNSDFVHLIETSESPDIYVFNLAHDGLDGERLIIKTTTLEQNSQWSTQFAEDVDEILVTDTVDNLGVIVAKSVANTLILYRFKIENDTITSFEKWIETKPYQEIGNLKAVSLVLYKELDNVIKAYIATGIWPILTIRIDDDTTAYGSNFNIDYLINNRIMPTSPIYIERAISGQLKTSLIQYTYRFYNKYGVTTRLAPLTNKIQVIDNNRNQELGNAEDTVTSRGFALKINYENSNFERMQIYRVLYIKENEDATVSLIYDGDKQTRFNDVGIDPLQILTMEEFSALSGIQVIPKVIEHNLDYMFASNVTDDTIIKDVRIETSSNTLSEVNVNVLLAKGSSMQMLPSKTGVDFTSSDYITSSNSNTISVFNYFEDRNVNKSIVKNTYNDSFTSSLLRSLRRGETYKYGIVYYDEYGRRTDVLSLGDIDIDSIQYNPTTTLTFTDGDENSHLDANVCGVRVALPQPKIKGETVKGLIGCQIVRRSSKNIYQKTLMLVALSRPMRQALLYSGVLNDESAQIVQSPYYPTGFLSSDHLYIWGYYLTENLYSGYSGSIDQYNTPFKKYSAKSWDNKGLFLIFSSEINFRRNDCLNLLLENNITLVPVLIFNPIEGNQNTFDTENKKLFGGNYTGLKFVFDSVNISETLGVSDIRYTTYIPKYDFSHRTNQDYIRQVDKHKDHLIYNYYNPTRNENNQNQTYQNDYKIISVQDVKIPKWYEGFSNIQYNGENIAGGIKLYKQFTTSIDEYTFNNWVSFGLYDLEIWDENLAFVFEERDNRTALFLYGQDPKLRDSISDEYVSGSNNTPFGWYYATYSKGFIGPGPSSLLIALDKSYHPYTNEFVDMQTGSPLGTYVCNIEHNVEFQNSEPDEYTLYFGFGNYFNLYYDEAHDEYNVDHNYGVRDNYMYVFDGDIYITPHEITTLYKTYDFNSKDTLESLQVTNYVPLESKVNTFFDYGMNYLNTQSTVLLYDSGSIEGVISQNRPAHQYNMIYSNNDVSNDVFSLISTDEKETNMFPHRTYYSEPKINGEFIDNFGIFKPASFIDVDSKYGELTNLLTDKNTLYYWLNTAFGKFSVNERSLINDLNGNTIMLGQAGILSRFDYISTKFGMRPYDYCATTADSKVYWIDINNRAIVVGNGQEAANLGESLNVLNIINKNIDSENIPKIDYDLLNNELLCKCLNDGEQLVFNTKYNIATSVYNRKYSGIVYIYNHMYGMYDDGEKLKFTKYNYLSVEQNNSYLSPVQLSFVVNNAASTTKVFDSQIIIPIKRPTYNGIDYTKAKPEEHNNVVGTFFDKDTTTEFETDILGVNNNTIEPHTDREGNIIYNIPRFGNNNWGNRMRGKWLRTSIDKEMPHEFFTISHVITKLRQSYS